MSQIENIKKTSYADGQQIHASQKNTSEAGASEVLQVENEKIDDGDLYKKVLEKLEIEPVLTQDSQEKFMQDSCFKNEPYPQEPKLSEKTQKQTTVENIVAQDFAKIENLMQLGIINPLQGQNLKLHVQKKAFDMLVQNGNISQNSPPASSINKSEVFNEFTKNNPDFFSHEGRNEVLDYLKSDDVIVGKDDLNKISGLIETIEQKAIDRYLKKMTYEKNLNDSNEAAKQRLTANAQNSSFHDKNLSRTFTREQIGKMSGAEFAKYEPIIMQQLKKGLIK